MDRAHGSDHRDRYDYRNRRLLGIAAFVVVLLLGAMAPAAALAPDGPVESQSPTPSDHPRVSAPSCSGQCQFWGGVSLASIFPLGSDREVPELSDPEVVEFGTERAGELFDVLASETARTLLQRLDEEPQTAAELSEAVDTSLQNVHYHLNQLREAGAIAEIDVEYSERGREMSVYAATCQLAFRVYETS